MIYRYKNPQLYRSTVRDSIFLLFCCIFCRIFCRIFVHIVQDFFISIIHCEEFFIFRKCFCSFFGLCRDFFRHSGIKLNVSVTFQTCSGRDQLTNDNVFFQTYKMVNFTFDCCFCQNLSCLHRLPSMG